jgi:hypothetical protein
MGLEAGGVSVSSLGRRGGSWGRSWSGGALVLIPRRRRRFPSSRLPPRRFVSPPPVVSCPPSFRVPRHFVVPAIHPASKWLAGEGRGPFRRCRRCRQ